MNNYYKNQKVIKKWVKLLNLILINQRCGLYDIIKNDYKMNRIIEVIEEYHNIIFKEEE